MGFILFVLTSSIWNGVRRAFVSSIVISSGSRNVAEFLRIPACWLTVLLITFNTWSSPSARAEGKGLPTPFVTGAVEWWSGADATRHSWSTYSGVNWSPFGKLADDGLRFRFTGGYGEYRYSGWVDGGTETIYGTATFADLLAGYQLGLGALTLKAFAGATFDGHFLTEFDTNNPVNANATGAKGVLEGWLNVTPSTWAQVDLAYATAHASYSSRLRLGHRVAHGLSLGVEGGQFGNEASDNGRLGGFARYDWLGGELSVSGGVSGDIAAPRNPYGTLVYMTKF